MNYVCYVFVRHLPRTLNPGKLAAQVHHAATHMVLNNINNSQLKQWLSPEVQNDFGTTIVLEADCNVDTKDQISDLVFTALQENLVAGIITDPTYPVDFELNCPVVTCGYILVDKDSNSDKIQELLEEIETRWSLYN